MQKEIVIKDSYKGPWIYSAEFLQVKHIAKAIHSFRSSKEVNKYIVRKVLN